MGNEKIIFQVHRTENNDFKSITNEINNIELRALIQYLKEVAKKFNDEVESGQDLKDLDDNFEEGEE